MNEHEQTKAAISPEKLLIISHSHPSEIRTSHYCGAELYTDYTSWFPQYVDFFNYFFFFLKKEQLIS